MGSFAAAFRRLAREIVATGAPLARLMDRLSGDIAAFLVPGAVLPEEMTEEQRASIEEVRRILGGYDAKTQQEALLRAQAKEYLPKRTEEWAEIMGLYPTGVKITGAKTRFGSCSGTNSICYSWRLMAYPKDAIDYVIVHELAHIAQKNHAARFYALVAQYLPDWKKRRNLLKTR